MATPVEKYQQSASQPAFVSTDCTDTQAKSALYAVGDAVIADGLEYFVTKATTQAAQICPTDDEAAKSASTRLYARAQQCIAQKDLTDAERTARAADQTKCVYGHDTYCWWATQLACTDANNNSAPTKTYACNLPEWCPTFNPNKKVTTKSNGTPASAVWNSTLPKHNPVFDSVNVWERKETAPVEENPVKVRPAATKFRKGKRYAKGSLAFHQNEVRQCLSKTKCGSQAPTETADAVWGTPVRTTLEIAAQATLPWNKGLGFVDAADKVYAEEWAADALTKATAYDEGSEAIGEDGKVYKCAPQEISGNKVSSEDKAQTAEIKTQITKQTGDATYEEQETTGSYEYNVNCARYPPGSKAGKKYWKASTTVISSKNQPPMDLQPWVVDSGYGLKDKAVVGTVVYNCVAADFCNSSPATDAGKLGWKKTPFTTVGVDSFKSNGTVKPKLRWTLHVDANRYAYSKGDHVRAASGQAASAGLELQSAALYYKCVAVGSQCRYPFKKADGTAVDGSTVAKAYPVAIAGAWEAITVEDRWKYQLNQTAAKDNTARAVATEALNKNPLGKGSKQITEQMWGKLARRTKWGLAHVASKAYKTGERSCEPADKLAAWVCSSASGCAASAAPATAGGWSITRTVCVIKTQAELDTAKSGAKTTGYAYARGQAYRGNDIVVLGGGAVGEEKGIAYKCVAAEARNCGRVHPEVGERAGPVTVWTQLDGVAITKAAPVAAEVVAIPLETLLANPSLRVRFGQYMQYKGVAYKCTDTTGVLCAGGAKAQGDATNTLGKLDAKMKLDKERLKAPLVVEKFSGGACKPGKTTTTDAKKAVCSGIAASKTKALCNTTATKTAGCIWQGIVPKSFAPRVRIDVEKYIFDELLDSPGAASPTKGWEQTWDTPKKGKGAWDKLNTKDAGALAKSGVAVACDEVSTKPAALGKGGDNAVAVPRWWLKGQVYCDAKSGKAYTCKDPLKCHLTTSALNPKTATDAQKALAAFTDIWTPVAATATAGKLFVAKQDLQGSQNKNQTKAWDWDVVNPASGTYTGSYAFKSGDNAVNGSPARLWKCVGKAADCKATAPKLDTTGKKWRLLTLDALAFTAAEMAAKAPVTQQCFKWVAGYPFLANDVVCDPAAPTSRSWTVRDPVVASQNKPTLKDEKRLREAWGLTTQTARNQPDGTQVAGVIQFETIAAPAEGAAVKDCLGWDDRVGATQADIGSNSVWCKGGRVYTCTETAVATKRPCCTKTSPETAGNRCWSLLRTRGTRKVVTAATLDADYKQDVAGQFVKSWPARDLALGCTSSARFGTQGSNWSAATQTVTDGALKTLGGRVCVVAKDAAAGIAWLARLRSAQVTPRGKISDAYVSATKTTWGHAPMNVQVFDNSVDGAALEEVLAGVMYRDAAHRRVLLNVIGWFPGICGDRPATRSAEPWKAVCRGDVAAAITFALMGEGDAASYAEEKRVWKIESAAQWWQTAFRTVADSDCFDAERRATKTGAGDIVVVDTATSKVTTNFCRFKGTVRGSGSTALIETATGAVIAPPASAKKHFYARGAGPVPLVGAAEYGAFSKAITGSETAFALTPEALLGYGVRWGAWRGAPLGVMPMAVALWRYVTPAADTLPSVHEVATGMWTPSTAEKASGLGAFRGDFCTVVTLVTAMQALASGGNNRMPFQGYKSATATGAGADATASIPKLSPWEATGVPDGSLGTAWRAIHARLGAALPAAPVVTGQAVAPYDYSCRNLAKNAVQKVAATRGWPVNASAQKTWLAPNIASPNKCTFANVPGVARLSVFADGDAARCEMASADADKTKTQTARYAEVKNEPYRQECQLWSADNKYAWSACHHKTPNTTNLIDGEMADKVADQSSAAYRDVQPTVHCLACVPLPLTGATKCDATCLADFTTTKHALWVCADARSCANRAPETANAMAWRPWLHWVNAAATTGSKADGTAVSNAAFGLYAVREQPLVGNTVAAATTTGKQHYGAIGEPNGSVPCVPYPRAFADKLKLEMLENMDVDAADGGTRKLASRIGGLRQRWYVCELTHKTLAVDITNDLRAYAPKTGVAATLLTAANAAGDSPNSSNVTNARKWLIVSGAMGRVVPTFAERYPDCLEARASAISAIATFDFNSLAGGLDAGFEMLAFDETQRTLKPDSTAADANMKLVNEAYNGQKGGATGADWGSTANVTSAGWLYKVGPKIGVAVDAVGNLCANLQGKLKLVANSGTAAMDLPKPTAAARAFIGSIKDANFSKAFGDLMVAADDATKQGVITAAKTYPNLEHAQAILPLALFTKLTAGAAGTVARAHLKYWDFLAALVSAPALCNVAGSGKLTGVAARAICARDLAGLWAAMVATTNTHDKTKATPATSGAAAAKPYHLQGFDGTAGILCKRPKAAVMTVASASFEPALKYQCEDAKISATPTWALYTSAANQWCAASGDCAANTVVFAPRGPLALSGVLDTYHFSTHAQGLLVSAATSAMKDPATVLGDANAGSYAYWLSAVFKWMVPMGGRPAPHNIMTGLWEPSAKDAAAGVPEGFGAVTKLLAPDVCGSASKGQRAQVWRDTWTALAGTEGFNLAAVNDGSAKVSVLVSGEKADCAGADQAPFPAGVWAQVPVYFTQSYKQAGVPSNPVRGLKSQRCWGTQTVSKYFAYKQGAYADCAFANKAAGDDDSAKAATSRLAYNGAEVTAFDAANKTLWGSEGDKWQEELRCRAAAVLLTHTTTAKKDKTARIRAALRVCTLNIACEKKASYCAEAPTIFGKVGSECTGGDAAAKLRALRTDVKKLALCPLNADCLRRAGGEPARRKACYLLDHVKALAQDALVKDAATW